MFTRILVPVDGSRPAKAATTVAIRFAKLQHSSLTFVFVADVTHVAYAGSPSSYLYLMEAEHARGEAVLKAASRLADRVGVDASTILVEGFCVDKILEVAGRRGSDMIVIGSHSRTGLSRLVLGSVAEGVLRSSRVPVLVVHGRKRPSTGRARTAKVSHAREVQSKFRRAKQLVQVF